MTATANAPIRVLIVDDHPVVRAGLSNMLSRCSEITLVGEASSGADALESLSATPVDVVLLDLRMPSMSGIDVLRVMKSKGVSTRAIMLTSFEGDEDIYQSIQAGAWGYLLKEIGLAEMVSAICTVNSGRRYIRGEIAERLAARMSRCDLTGREIEVLRMVARGLTNKAIGKELYISSLTVKNHVNSILTKLQVSDRTQASTAAIQRGLIGVDL